MIAGTLQTDPRSGGIKRSSGVNVLPIVAQSEFLRRILLLLARPELALSFLATLTIPMPGWSQVRDDGNVSVDWILVGYDGDSKTDITLLAKGNGGIDSVSNALPLGKAVFGGCRLKLSGRFVTFFYADDSTPAMQKGRASLHKNGVMNVLEGSDGEIGIRPEQTEIETTLPVSGGGGSVSASISHQSFAAEQAMTQFRIVADEKPESRTQSLEVAAKPPTATVSPSFDTCREQSLSDTEFIKVFGMDKTAFAKLAAWRQTSLKKTNGLF